MLMKFQLNREKLKELAKFRGWRSIYTALANDMDFSVSYCRRVVLGKERLTEYFMLRYIKLAGCNPRRHVEWASLFDVDLEGDIPPPHSPAMNGLKLNGLGMKYTWSSPSHEFRKGDNPQVEEETVDDFLKRKKSSVVLP